MSTPAFSTPPFLTVPLCPLPQILSTHTQQSRFSSPLARDLSNWQSHNRLVLSQCLVQTDNFGFKQAAVSRRLPIYANNWGGGKGGLNLQDQNMMDPISGLETMTFACIYAFSSLVIWSVIICEVLRFQSAQIIELLRLELPLLNEVTWSVHRVGTPVRFHGRYQ